MANPTYTELRNAVLGVFKSIQGGPNYTNVLPLANFHSNFSAKAQQRGEPAEYPKIFMTTGDIKRTKYPDRQIEVRNFYYVTIAVLQADRGAGFVNVEPTLQLESILEDVEKAIDANFNLGGKVSELNLESISYDSGFSHPEGIAIFELSTTHKRRFYRS